VVPKTGPSGSIIWIIIAALAIFGGYIYIRKRADI
jgi:LPXTG-motif cell wall-anchored protein